MSYFCGTAAYGSVGTKTVTVGFAPKGVRITVGQRFGGADNYVHQSVGFSNGANTFCTSLFQDTTSGLTINSGKLVSHYERVGGVISEVLAVNFHSFTPTQVKFTVTLPTANYNLTIEAWD